MGVSPSNLHLSLYWSRLGQRISIPFLLASATDVSTGIVFWATIVPFLTFAAMEFLYWRPRPDRARRSRRRGKLRLRKHDGSSNSSSSISSDSHTLQLYISRHRAEADKLTALLANNVELRQRAERQRGGLVILSAKYGIRGAPPEEIADVTVAVAALVDGGSLVIPAGLRKSHLLGFWDPAPGKTKVLSVRYMYQGAESAAEVAGGEEFRLP
ncbi:hypothetical protein VTK73DRAFT_6541 [Phialemonium thermophilum]|uniref:DnaJ-like protein C11 C-terminal domain-containing protein n=1 Tax=Phialemonium thermophilum TaxID=223376 RepID=A0ABR3XVC4_9PEZI